MYKSINLYKLQLTEISESDLKALCNLNNFKPNELEYLCLYKNNLIDLDFITSNTPFINLKNLKLGNNKITDLNNIKYLVNLEDLDISNLKLKDEKIY